MVPKQVSRTARTASGGTTSPPAQTSFRPAKVAGASSAISRNRPAVNHMLVSSWRSISPRSPPVSRCPAGATTTVPPFSSGIHSSWVEASKAIGECSSTRAWCPVAYTLCAARSATFRCVTTTPFGTPVEPEVNITYALWSGWTDTAGSPAEPPPGPVAGRTVMPAGRARSSARSVTRQVTAERSRISCTRSAG